MPFVRSTDGVRLHYRSSGRRSGAPVLMIQGLGADKHLWDLQRVALAPWHHTVALDNRGAGRSDKPHGAYSLEQMADDAIAVLDAAEIESAHIVGASMGGVISQLIALRHPTRVRSLTLACTACQHHEWRRELLAEWAEIAQTRGMAAMTSVAAPWVIGPRSFRRLTPAVGWMGPLALSRPPHAFAGQVAGILDIDHDLADRLTEITAPTLVLVGNQDILTPRGDSEFIADLIPNSELAVISGAAHGFMIEHWSTFNSILLDFLGRAERLRRGTAASSGSTDGSGAEKAAM